MSAPKRGMVAGQAITTQAQTKEFDEGYRRIFGEAKPRRGRYRYDSDAGRVVEVGADWTDADERARVPTEEIIYGNGIATDGTPINTRKRHREYLRANGLAMSGDFSPEYRERNARNAERADDKARRETVERAYYKQAKKG